MRHELEQMLRAGHHQAVIKCAERWFAAQRGNAPESLWVAILACGAAGGLADWHGAVRWADLAEQLNADEDREASAWLNFLLGTALMYIGDLLRSQRALRRFCDDPPFTRTLQQWAPDGLYNLGFLMRATHQLDPAVESYSKAAAIYTAQGRHSRVIWCHREIAWSYLLCEQPSLALGEIEAAQALLPDHGDPELAADIAILRALFYQELGLVPESMALCDELTDFYDLAPRQRGDLAWMIGRNALSVGDVQAAVEWAEEAEDYALKNWWPPLLERVKELKAAIAHHSGRLL